MDTALVLRNACEDASSYWVHRYTDYHNADYAQAEQRLTEFLDYFDPLAENMEDRVSEASRSLSQERALLVKLLDNVRNR